MRKLLKDAENEIRMQDIRLMVRHLLMITSWLLFQEQKVVQDPVFIRKITESTRLLNRSGVKVSYNFIMNDDLK